MAESDMTDDSTLPVPIGASGNRALSTLDQLADIPEEEKAKERAHPARVPAGRAALHAHAGDHHAGGIAPGRLQRVIAWERYMRETEHARPRRSAVRLAALSSLYKHLVRHGHAAPNPVGEVERPAINRDEGSTLAFAKAQARKLLDLPEEDTVAGLRDRAIFSVGLQVGLRRAEIAALKVGDLHQNRGYDSLRVMRKGGLSRITVDWDTSQALGGASSHGP
jgi:integrase/recombinase XerD